MAALQAAKRTFIYGKSNIFVSACQKLPAVLAQILGGEEVNMGTIEVGFDCESTGAFIQSRIERGKRPKEVFLGRDVYQNCRSATIDGRYAALSWKPRRKYIPASKYRLQAHLSHFASIDEFWAWLKDLSGPYFEHVLGSRFMRLDCYVDVQVPMSKIRESILYKNGKNSGEYRSHRNGGGETIEWGSSKLRNKAYTRKVKRGMCDYFGGNGGGHTDEEIDVVRIEVKLKGRRLPFKTLRELELLRSIYPFDHLKVLNVHDHIVDDAPPNIKILWAAYKWEASQKNAMAAKQLVNANRNWSRTIGPYLDRTNSEDFLEIAWATHLHRFFNMEEVPSRRSLIGLSEYIKKQAAQIVM